MAREYLCREWLIEDARAAVLNALDTWARECGLPNLPARQEGATDADLPKLFPAIDGQVDRIIQRSGFVMPDAPYSQQFLDKTREQLDHARRVK